MAIAVLPRSRANTFDPDTIAVLTAAFEDVCQSLARNGMQVGPEETAARELVAKAIIEIALIGERDRIRLRDTALHYLAKDH
jgi:hypothetical protein